MMMRKKWIVTLLLSVSFASARTLVVSESGYQAFADGKFEGLSLNESGRIRTAPKVRHLADLPVTTVWQALPDGDGGLWISAGEEAQLYHLDADGTLEERFVSGGNLGYGLATDPSGNLYFGVSSKAVIYQLGKDSEKAQVFSQPEAQYIWAMQREGNLLYITTGFPAKLYTVNIEDGTTKLLYEAGETHFTKLLLTQEYIYLGSSPNGIVYRVNRDGKGGAFFNPKETEVNGLGLDDLGNLWVGTYLETTSQKKPSLMSAEKPIEEFQMLMGFDEDDFQMSGSSDLKIPDGSPDKPRSSGLVYRVSPDGYALPIWASKEGGILSMQQMNGPFWLVGLEESGILYGIQSREKWQRIVTLDKGGSVVQILPAEDADGGFWIVSSNPAAVYLLGGIRETPGVYYSNVVDCNQQVIFGSFEILAEGNPTIEVSTRTGNTAVVDKSWSPWQTLEGELQNGAWRGDNTSPAGRYVQYKISLVSKSNFEGIARVRLFVKLPNIAPVITSLFNIPRMLTAQQSASSPRPLEFNSLIKGSGINRLLNDSDARIQFSEETGTLGRTLLWEATDPNGDDLRFNVYIQSMEDYASKTLVEADITEKYFAFSTSGLREGYYRFILEALDRWDVQLTETGTAMRQTEPFLVDQQAPVIRIFPVEGSDELEIQVQDEWSVIEIVSMKINGGETIELTPEDGFGDEREEHFRIRYDGQQTLQIQAVDESGQVARALYPAP